MIEDDRHWIVWFFLFVLVRVDLLSVLLCFIEKTRPACTHGNIVPRAHCVYLRTCKFGREDVEMSHGTLSKRVLHRVNIHAN